MTGRKRALMREVAELSWPAILQGLVTTLIFFVDRVLLGQYSEEALASMQVSGPVLWSVFSVLGAFGAGTMAVIGRSVGAGETERVHKTLLAVLGLALVIGTLAGAVGWWSRHGIADVMVGAQTASPEVHTMAVLYMGIVFPGAPLGFMSTVAMVALQASGDTRSPMWISAVTGLANLAVSWVLIFGHFGTPEMGIEGGAIGSLTALVVQWLLMMAVLWRTTGPVRLMPLVWPGHSPLGPVLKVSLPAFGERLIFHTGFLVFAGLVGRLGDAAMTANQGLVAIESLGFMVSYGFGIAGGALAAQKLGAERVEDASLVGWFATALGAAVLGVVGLIFLLFAEPLVLAFVQHEETVQLGVECLMIAAIAQPFMGITDALAGSLRGAGDTRSPMVVALVGPIAVRLTGCWYLAFHLDWGLSGIWIATTLDWMIRAVILAAIWKRGRWKTIKV